MVNNKRKWIKVGDRVQTLRYGTGTVKDVYVIAGTEYADVWLRDYQRDHHPHVCWTGDLKRATA
jgi:hypothetical protein